MQKTVGIASTRVVVLVWVLLRTFGSSNSPELCSLRCLGQVPDVRPFFDIVEKFQNSTFGLVSCHQKGTEDNHVHGEIVEPAEEMIHSSV